MRSIAAALQLRAAIWVALVVALPAQAPEEFVIDPTATSIIIHVGRAGVFAFAGHDHEVVAPAVQGQITLDRSDPGRSSVSAEFDATALKVTGKGEPPGDVPEVQRVMLSERVLNAQRYRTIRFQSRTISVVQRSADRMTLRIVGDLTLRGVTQPLTVPVNVQLISETLRADGKVAVRQTAVGIQPVTAGAGTVRVKDEVDVTFSIMAKQR